jgi:hypothetical protein
MTRKRTKNYNQLPLNTNQTPYIPQQGNRLQTTTNFLLAQIKHLHSLLGKKKPFVLTFFILKTTMFVHESVCEE